MLQRLVSGDCSEDKDKLLMMLLLLWLLIALSASTLALPLSGQQKMNFATCFTNRSKDPDNFGIIMSLKNGTIQGHGSAVFKIIVPSNKKFSEIKYTAYGHANGIPPGSNFGDAHVVIHSAKLDEFGEGEFLITNIPESMENKVYIMSFFTSHGTEIQCTNVFPFQEVAAQHKSETSNTAISAAITSSSATPTRSASSPLTLLAFLDTLAIIFTANLIL